MTDKDKQGLKRSIIIWRLFAKLSMVLFVSALIVVFVRAYADYIKELPLLFEIGVISGSIFLIIKVLSINWWIK